MTVKFTNNASTTVATGINTTATSLVVASAAGFPALSGSGDYCYLTIQQAAGTNVEVVKATALSSNTFTIVRAQDGTSAGSWSVSDVVELRVTAALLTDIVDAATHDSSVLSVDSTNNRVGVNDTTPSVTLDISGTDAIALPVGTTAERPTGAAGRFRYNSSLSQFEGYTDAWGAIGGGGTNTFTTDTFTANGSLVAFNLSQTVASANNLLCFIDGVFQTQDAYAIATASGTTTLTFSAAPANGRKIVVYSVAAGISGTNLNVDSMTGDGSDVTLTLTINTIKENTQVFIDGVYQAKANYSISGTTLTFSTAPPAGSAVECVTMTQTEINVPVDGTITSAKLSGALTTPSDLTVTGEITANGGIALGDSDKATFGASDDLQIYHDGTDSFLIDNGTGRLNIRSSSDFLIANTANSQNYLYAVESGAVTLFHSGSTKLATTATGIDVTGTATMGAMNVTSGLASGTGIGAGGANGNLRLYANGVQAVTVATTGSVGINTSSPTGLFTSYKSQNGDPKLGHFYNDNTGTAAEAAVYITNSSSVSDGLFLQTYGQNGTTAGGFVQDASIIGSGTGASGGLSIMTRANADMRFYTNGHTNERMRIDGATGNVRIGGTSAISNPYLQMPNFADVNLDGTWGGVISFKLGGVTKGWVGQRSSGNADMVVGATANEDLLFYANDAEKMRITSDQIRVGGAATAYTPSQFEISALAGVDRHSRSINSGGNSYIAGSGQRSIMAEGVVAVNTVSAGTILTIPHTSQTGLWRPMMVELMFVTGEYNRTMGSTGGWAKFGYSVLNGVNGLATMGFGGNVAGVSASGINILVTFGAGYTSGTANYEGVCMYYKVMSITPEYFQAWNATLN